MGEAAFGRSFDTLQRGENIAFMEDLDKLIIMLAVVSWLSSLSCILVYDLLQP